MNAVERYKAHVKAKAEAIRSKYLIDMVVSDQYGRVVARARKSQDVDHGVDARIGPVTYTPRHCFSLSDDDWYYSLPDWTY